MSVSAALGKFKGASKDLQVRWNETQQFWRDENCRHFEEQYLAPLLARLRSAEAALVVMDDVLIKLRRECS
jgi:hypothetical protein